MATSQEILAGIARETGLQFGASFISDKLFYLALLAAPVAVAMVPGLFPVCGQRTLISWPFAISVILWQPVIEEILFRGVIQGQLRQAKFARSQIAGISVANCLASLLFMLAHLIHHSPGWAAAVFVPSLVFGYFRDRHDQLYPAMLLHAFYNACYFLIGAGFLCTRV